MCDITNTSNINRLEDNRQRHADLWRTSSNGDFVSYEGKSATHGPFGGSSHYSCYPPGSRSNCYGSRPAANTRPDNRGCHADTTKSLPGCKFGNFENGYVTTECNTFAQKFDQYNYNDPIDLCLTSDLDDNYKEVYCRTDDAIAAGKCYANQAYCSECRDFAHTSSACYFELFGRPTRSG